jgi:hypothetical protein
MHASLPLQTPQRSRAQKYIGVSSALEAHAAIVAGDGTGKVDCGAKKAEQ